MKLLGFPLIILCATGVPVACGSSPSGSPGTGGNSAGSTGSAGTGSAGTGTGAAGTGASGTGVAGTTGGTPGTAGTTGTAGTAATTGRGGSSGGTATGGNAAGTTGRAGTGGSGSGTSGTTGTAGTAATGQSVLERNKNPSRDGHFLQPTLTKAMAGKMARDTGFTATYTADMWASPLYIENGPGGKGAFFAVTTANNVIAFDETSGAALWTRSIGTAATGGGGQCSRAINPLGILSTPVIDAQTRTIYVAGAIGDATGITGHIASAISIEDGTVRDGWPVNVGTAANFDAKYHNQRSALSLVGGILYVAYGGFVGDCNNYHGRVVAINTSNRMAAGWATGGVGEAIWAPGGLASDGNGVFAVTGNRTMGDSATHADSEEIVRVTGMATVARDTANMFFPSSWRNMDSSDADFGVINSVYVEVAGATPSTILVGLTKDGHMFLLNSKNLGGMGGQLVDFQVASGAMSIYGAPTAYRTAMGTHVAFAAKNPSMCPAAAGSAAVVSVLIPAGAPPMPRVQWCAPMGGDLTGPIATTTDGTTDAVVWYMSNGKLTAVDGDTGTSVFTSTDTCAVTRWTSPIAVKGRIVVGGTRQLCSWSPH